MPIIWWFVWILICLHWVAENHRCPICINLQDIYYLLLGCLHDRCYESFNIIFAYLCQSLLKLFTLLESNKQRNAWLSPVLAHPCISLVFCCVFCIGYWFGEHFFADVWLCSIVCWFLIFLHSFFHSYAFVAFTVNFLRCCLVFPIFS